MAALRQNDPSHPLLRNAQELGLEARAYGEDHAWQLRHVVEAGQRGVEARAQAAAHLRFHQAARQVAHLQSGAMAVVTGRNITALTDDLERVRMVHSEQSSDAKR